MAASGSGHARRDRRRGGVRAPGPGVRHRCPRPRRGDRRHLDRVDRLPVVDLRRRCRRDRDRRDAVALAVVAAVRGAHASRRRRGAGDRRHCRGSRAAARARDRGHGRRRGPDRRRRAQPPPRAHGRSGRLTRRRVGGRPVGAGACRWWSGAALHRDARRRWARVREGLRTRQPRCRPPVPELPHAAVAGPERRPAGVEPRAGRRARGAAPADRAASRRHLSAAGGAHRVAGRLDGARGGVRRRHAPRRTRARSDRRHPARRGLASRPGTPCGAVGASVAPGREHPRVRRQPGDHRPRVRHRVGRPEDAGDRPRRAARLAGNPRRGGAARSPRGSGPSDLTSWRARRPTCNRSRSRLRRASRRTRSCCATCGTASPRRPAKRPRPWSSWCGCGRGRSSPSPR